METHGISFVQKYVMMSEKDIYVRLDTGLDEKVVRKKYLNAGLKIVDIIDYDNGRSVALFELEV